MKDLLNNIIRVPLLSPISKANTGFNSAYIDLQGYEGCVIEIEFGVIVGADGSNYLTPTLYDYMEADYPIPPLTVTPVTPAPGTASNYAAVAAASLQGAFAAVKDTTTYAGAIQRVGYLGSKRYLYVGVAYTGTPTSEVMSISAILGLAGNRPAGEITPTTGAVS